VAGVQPVICDAHTGLKAAIGLGTTARWWPPHDLRAPRAEHVFEPFEVFATIFGKQLAKVEAMLRDAREDLLAFTEFPVSHWKKI
jgi:putative transposase